MDIKFSMLYMRPEQSTELRILQDSFIPYPFSVKKNPAPQDSPPAAGRLSGIVPIRRSAICAERFYFTGRTFL